MMKIIVSESQIKRLLEIIDNPQMEDIVGKRVMVYYNLHKKTFSVTYESRVVLHADYIKLSNVEFRVRKGGKDKVRGEKRKNVHAFVIGTLEDYCEYPCDKILIEPNDNVVTYNPYENDTFVYKQTGQPIFNASRVAMINLTDKLYIISSD